MMIQPASTDYLEHVRVRFHAGIAQLLERDGNNPAFPSGGLDFKHNPALCEEVLRYAEAYIPNCARKAELYDRIRALEAVPDNPELVKKLPELLREVIEIDCYFIGATSEIWKQINDTPGFKKELERYRLPDGELSAHWIAVGKWVLGSVIKVIMKACGDHLEKILGYVPPDTISPQEAKAYIALNSGASFSIKPPSPDYLDRLRSDWNKAKTAFFASDVKTAGADYTHNAALQQAMERIAQSYLALYARKFELCDRAPSTKEAAHELETMDSYLICLNHLALAYVMTGNSGFEPEIERARPNEAITPVIRINTGKKIIDRMVESMISSATLSPDQDRNGFTMKKFLLTEDKKL